MSSTEQIFEIVLDLPNGSRKVGDLFWSEHPFSSGSPTMAFRYDRSWLENGFSLGGDLPISDTVLYPSAAASGERNGVFGFIADHMPGKWLCRLVECAHLKGFKYISDGLSPSASLLWAQCRTHPHRFSALTVGLPKHSVFQWPEFVGELERPRFAREAAFYLECAAHYRGPAKASDAEAVLALCAGLPGERPAIAAPTLHSGPAELIYGFADEDASDNPPMRTAVLRELARHCSIDVLEGHPFGQRLYAEQRYDRSADGQPLLVLSAATLAQSLPLPASFVQPAFSYLTVADIINREGCSPACDLERLFKRALFLKLLGFSEAAASVHFVRKQNGWSLAPLSPVALSSAGGQNNAGVPIRSTPSDKDDLEALLTTARYYGISVSHAKALRLEFMRELSEWKSVAQSLGAGLMEISRLQSVFAALK